MNVALIALAARQAQQRELVQRLHDEGATTPERAQPLSEDDAQLLESLVEEGIVVQASPGAFYVDPVKYAESVDPRPAQESARKALEVLIVIAAAAFAGLLVCAVFVGLLAFLVGEW